MYLVSLIGSSWFHVYSDVVLRLKKTLSVSMSVICLWNRPFQILSRVAKGGFQVSDLHSAR